MSSRTRSRNAFESQLNGAITAGATTITLDSTTGLTDPLYLCIDPNDPALREFIRADGISGSQLTSVTRGLAGSAAGGQAHASGAPIRTIMTHQALDDIFDDVEALETADAGHFGGTDTADHPEATTSVRGFMSAADKTKLDGVEAGAEVNVQDHDVLSNVSVDDHHAQSHAHNGADSSGTVAHSDTTGKTADDHHNEDHASRHADGGADELTPIALGWPGAFEVDDFDQNNGGVGLGTSMVNVQTVTLAIPGSWNSWKCQVWATGQAYKATGAFGDIVEFELDVRIDGTDVGVSYFGYATATFETAYATQATRSGMTTTGNRTVALRARRLSSAVTLDALTLYARAVRLT